MPKIRSIIVFWVLFLVPALMIAGFACTLLLHEQERINLSSVRALSQRAQAIAETIHVTIETIQDNLEQSLQEIDKQRIEDELLPWEQENPLVRNVFVFQPGQKLLYPQAGTGAYETRRFVARYEPFFSGRVKFDVNTLAESDKNIAASSSYKPAKKVKKQHSSRQELLALSRLSKTRQGVLQDMAAQSESGQEYIGRSGWVPWFSENQLFILGWVQKYEGGPIYGIEMEWITLLSRLVVDLPVLEEKNAAMTLVDGRGNIMHQMGAMTISSDSAPAIVLNVSELLPHWQIAVYADNKGSGRGFLILSLILLGIFIIAMVSAGILITRMALKNAKDAREKTSFVSSVSHELKTPLTSIRMYAELLLSKRVKDENKAENYLSVIVNESQRLTRLINNVLDFGKLEQGKKSYQFQNMNLAHFVSEMIEAHSIRIQEKGLTVETRLPDPENGKDWTVKSDRDALEQVFLNLLDNALKYAGHGEFIKFVLKSDKSYFDLMVCDDGPGISKAHQDMIFKKFYRINDSLTAEKPGSGLGLSIARQILRDLGGDLIFKSMPENGSCFTARIKDHGSD